MIAGISTEPKHLAMDHSMVERVVEVAVGVEGVGGGGEGGGGGGEEVWHLAQERVEATTGSVSWCCRWSNIVSQMS